MFGLAIFWRNSTKKYLGKKFTENSSLDYLFLKNVEIEILTVSNNNANFSMKI